jgi:hypothetical protein
VASAAAELSARAAACWRSLAFQAWCVSGCLALNGGQTELSENAGTSPEAAELAGSRRSR